MEEKDSIEIIVNGVRQTVGAGLAVADFVAQLQLRAERVAVELNLEILPRRLWQQTSLRDGDRLEIVHFVGGGHQYQSESDHMTLDESRVSWVVVFSRAAAKDL